jgi:hypothetical protein
VLTKPSSIRHFLDNATLSKAFGSSLVKNDIADVLEVELPLLGSCLVYSQGLWLLLDFLPLAVVTSYNVSKWFVLILFHDCVVTFIAGVFLDSLLEFE